MVTDSSEWIEILSFAKINLMLDVVKKREDGYHEIVSLFQEISLHDLLYVRKISEKCVKLTGVELPPDNTIKRAYEVFNIVCGVDFGIEVKMIKRIPQGAGLGGGSSNAGAILRYLAKETGVSDLSILTQVAERVGSDVPFFLHGGTAIVTGRGEKVEPLDDLPSYGVTLFVPSIKINTKNAYSYLKISDFLKAPCPPKMLYEAYREGNLEKIKYCSYNVFQEVFLPVYHELEMTLKLLKKEKPITALMTGSGSAFFGIKPPGKGTFRFISRKERENYKEGRKPM